MNAYDVTARTNDADPAQKWETVRNYLTDTLQAALGPSADEGDVDAIAVDMASWLEGHLAQADGHDVDLWEVLVQAARMSGAASPLATD